MMPYQDPDATDPNMLVGVVLPAEAEATRDMAYVFAEEFARMGYKREQIIGLFKNRFYGGAYGAYQSLGESEIVSIVDECIDAWGHVQFSILDFGSIAEQRGEIHNPHSSLNQNRKAVLSTVEGSKIQNGDPEE